MIHVHDNICPNLSSMINAADKSMINAADKSMINAVDKSMINVADKILTVPFMVFYYCSSNINLSHLLMGLSWS